jgi:hypothetical protein
MRAKLAFIKQLFLYRCSKAARDRRGNRIANQAKFIGLGAHEFKAVRKSLDSCSFTKRKTSIVLRM